MNRLLARFSNNIAIMLLGAFVVSLTCSASWAQSDSIGKTRTYYIAADEVDWDYAPDGINKMMNMKFDGYAATFMQRGAHSIGKVYRKAIYREYTDATFTKLKPRGPEEQYLGILGPVLHAE